MSSTITTTIILLLFITLINIPKSQSQSPKFPCQPPHHNSYPFCNTALPIPTRAQSLLSLLSLSDKIKRLSNNDTGIPRLGIPPYEWWSESLHGIASNGPRCHIRNRTHPRRHRLPTSHSHHILFQSDVMVFNCFGYRRRSKGNVQRGSSRVDFLGSDD
ncbi:unnamed protein product [Lactuca saligna]|uniref:Uncharacterized protein n=1 Tax=Lactuca saligna TaxID=75948 RepID=A0AA36E5Y4_LACSI|nr:unnamed protein product [Lactuca saligna]